MYIGKAPPFTIARKKVAALICHVEEIRVPPKLTLNVPASKQCISTMSCITLMLDYTNYTGAVSFSVPNRRENGLFINIT